MPSDDALSEAPAGAPVEVTGALLAGGRSMRMGREKGLILLDGRPLVAHVIARLRPQVHRIVIIANDDQSRFSGYCLPVVADTVEGHLGPLAGLHAALAWALHETPGARFVATVPVDTPFFPDDMVKSLMAALRASNARSAIAASRGRRHPVAGLWQVELIDEVAEALAAGVRAMTSFAETQGSAVIDFPAVGGIDPFFNVNTPADLEHAEALLAAGAGAKPAPR
jgi:molybdopterin-guanine dinucleotide biosynthesis protein A